MNDDNLDKLTEFIQEHLKYKDGEQIRKYIKDHKKYGTIDYAIDENGNIIGIVRWNISEDGTVAMILDSAVKKEFRNRNIMKGFLERALKRFTKVTHLEYQRGLYGDERIRRLPINRVLESTRY